eukprot:4644801-Pyramimonas_sp.AAC.1
MGPPDAPSPGWGRGPAWRRGPMRRANHNAARREDRLAEPAALTQIARVEVDLHLEAHNRRAEAEVQADLEEAHQRDAV